MKSALGAPDRRWGAGRLSAVWIVPLALHRPYTFVVLGLLSILIISSLASLTIPTSIFSDINMPAVAVGRTHTGLSPKEMEGRLITIHERLPRVSHALTADEPLRIIAFGSSSTEGIGASSHATTYPNRLQVELARAMPRMSVIVINRGKGGEDAEDMARRLPDIIAQHPELVIWQTGTNDVLRDLPLERFVALTRAGILAMRAAGIDVMLIEPQRCGALQAKPGSLRYRDAVRAIGAELQVQVIRRYDLMQAWLSEGLLSPVQLMSGDGLHMGDGGYALLAKEVARAILSDAAAPNLTAEAG
jgi:acyl-CoA thioesterase-1